LNYVPRDVRFECPRSSIDLYIAIKRKTYDVTCACTHEWVLFYTPVVYTWTARKPRRLIRNLSECASLSGTLFKFFFEQRNRADVVASGVGSNCSTAEGRKSKNAPLGFRFVAPHARRARVCCVYYCVYCSPQTAVRREEKRRCLRTEKQTFT